MSRHLTSEEIALNQQEIACRWEIGRRRRLTLATDRRAAQMALCGHLPHAPKLKWSPPAVLPRKLKSVA
jgi:hypothetical protein